MPRRDLDRLTRRWQQRHDARRLADPSRPRANPGREALAKHGFPYRDVTPKAYVAEHGDAMPGFTYDDESYADLALDAWILEVGQLLRERREASSAPAKPRPAAKVKPASKPKPEPKPLPTADDA